MANADVINNTRVYTAAVTLKSVSLPASCVNESQLTAGQNFAADKFMQRHVIPYYQADGSDVAAAIVPIHIVKGATGTIKAFEVACVDAPAGGGDKEFTVDLKIANEGTPTPASVLTAVVTIDDTIADCEVVAGTIDSADLADGDMLLVVVAVSGSTGDQGQGLIVTLTVDETPL